MTVHREPAAAIEARNLVKTYRGDVRALNDLSFSVASGTVFGLLGPNGAGKSTTVKILTTLSRPDSGHARVMGVDAVTEPHQVRLAIGVVSQKSSSDPDATGTENMLLQGRIYGMRGTELKTRAAALLDRFGLGASARRLVRTYSGGMQRKLDVAMGLLHRPQVLFLDEPTTGLDPEARADMWNEIARLSTEDGLTVLLTTHYLEEADRLADRLAIVDKGHVVAEGTPDQLKAELRGDAIHVELPSSDVDGIARELIASVTGIHEIQVDGSLIRARADHGATAVPAVLGALDAGGVKVSSVTVSRPSLDDVYLRHAGRAYSEVNR